MTAMVGASVGLGLAGAVVLLVLGLSRRPVDPRRATRRRGSGLVTHWTRLSRRPSGAAGRRRDLWWLGSAAIAVAAFAVTGLPVALVAVPLVTILVPWLLSNPTAAGIVRTAAIDQWVRSLRSLLLSGSDNTLEGALQSSLATAPEAIREQVQLLVARINARWPTERALAMLATELADPTADVVAAALVLAAKRRGTGLVEVLEGLAVAVADEVRARRRIEGERASARAAARYLTMIFAAMAVGLALLNPTYLAPYATPLGQLVLLVSVLGFLVALWVVRRITIVKDPPRLWPTVAEGRAMPSRIAEPRTGEV